MKLYEGLSKILNILSLENYWDNFCLFLQELNKLIGANYSSITEIDDKYCKLKSTSNNLIFPITNNDNIFNNKNFSIIDFEKNKYKFFSSFYLQKLSQHLENEIKKCITVEIPLNQKNKLILLILFDNINSFNNFQINNFNNHFLSFLSAQISLSFENYQLYKEKIILIEDIIHEISEPLSNIYGYTEYLSKSVKPVYSISNSSSSYNPKNFENIYCKIRTSAAMALNLVRNLSFDVIPEKNIMRKDEIDDLLSLLIGCAIEYQALADLEDKKIKVLPSNIEKIPKFYTDSGLLKHVIKNILENAVKYADNETIIFIKPIIRYNYIDISIINWGIPIKEEYLKNIFIRGKRAVEAKKKTKGHGIALCVSKEIIEKLNGKILVEPSEFNKKNNNYKTTFVIRIYL